MASMSWLKLKGFDKQISVSAVQCDICTKLQKHFKTCGIHHTILPATSISLTISTKYTEPKTSWCALDLIFLLAPQSGAHSRGDQYWSYMWQFCSAKHRHINLYTWQWPLSLWLHWLTKWPPPWCNLAGGSVNHTLAFCNKCLNLDVFTHTKQATYGSV